MHSGHLTELHTKGLESRNAAKAIALLFLISLRSSERELFNDIFGAQFEHVAVEESSIENLRISRGPGQGK